MATSEAGSDCSFIKAGDKGIFVAASLFSIFLCVAVAVWGWGDAHSFFAQPARLSLVIVTVTLTILSCFSGSSGFSAGCRESARNRWIFVPLVGLSLAINWLAPYADRHHLGTIGDDKVRYLGLFILIVGGLLRLAAMFVLGHRFGALVAIQENHQLKTDGLYRFIRHPAYLGTMLGIAGWVLVFRSGIGLLLTALLLIPILERMHSEEELLAAEFGAAYIAYCRRTWRLLPMIY